MKHANVGQWLLKGKRRQKLLQQLSQPMTANQLYKKMQISRRDCSDVISDMCKKGILNCFNPDARRSRLYGLSNNGIYWRRIIFPNAETYNVPADVDWNLYGYVCYNHRKAVILALDRMKKPSGIKRHLRFIAPDIRISANNVRNIISELLSQNIVQPIDTGNAYPEYKLTDIGKKFQQLFRRADTNYMEAEI